ncbi:MAG TPA: aminotransferase class III-fold pyridoxal phosphate-dependent enzyme [Deltaproteobacteria bacterium]|nr:aminotransferase class III-fold pyridoxal phosphate-dependent enzyme [Deltaproteobacteria bacterium]HPR54733.1 aminotransferase class III-fold pyridoxal phosphate-dependent enzyme [Deltaproteobacteria bacterium]HXK48528.1 aminotransferase class III-fold pyridoxal phosphate-dependent enzyme [Deltaproteobacteria bacterium]
MKKTASKNAVRREDAFRDAAKVFSSSYVNMVQAKGHDFLEQGYTGSLVSDSEGNRLLDCYTSGAVFNLGRKNTAIIERFKRAIYETDQGNFVMPSQEKALLARRIAEFMPGNLDCVLFGVTRGESMDAACKLARGFTARPELITVDGGRYGESGFALSLTERPGKEQFGKLIQAVKVIPFGDVEAARSTIGNRTAAVVMEPVQAENHCRTADAGYYARVKALCESTGAKLVFDETQSGFGRTGTRFFFEQTGVQPDILIVGEAITSGMFPMTAMVFTPELKHFFDIHPLIHLCTFGGHDLGCLVAMTALDEYDRLEPWKNAARIGDRMVGELSALAEKNGSKIVSIAGKGLLLSIKLAAEDLARRFCAAARAGGLLVNIGETDRTTILIRPSLLISDEDATEIFNAITRTLEAV